MKDCGFIVFLFETMLEEVFLTKTNMAEELGVHYRTLQANFQKLGRHKGGCVALQNLFLYCFRNGISVDTLYARYLNQCEGKKGGSKFRTRMNEIACWDAALYPRVGGLRNGIQRSFAKNLSVCTG